MPGIFQLSIDEAVREAEAAQKAGVSAVILFGIPSKKDDKAKVGAADKKSEEKKSAEKKPPEKK